MEYEITARVHCKGADVPLHGMEVEVWRRQSDVQRICHGSGTITKVKPIRSVQEERDAAYAALREVDADLREMGEYLAAFRSIVTRHGIDLSEGDGT